MAINTGRIFFRYWKHNFINYWRARAIMLLAGKSVVIINAQFDKNGILQGDTNQIIVNSNI